MRSRTITLHAFCSVKGGVGKSTLAVACAKLLAREKPGSCVVIDADLTGTSLADGLRLCAPKVEVFEDGTLNLDAPSNGAYYTYEETRERRRERDAKGPMEPPKRPLPPVYFNDALLYRNDDGSKECQIDAMFWKHEKEDLVLYLPSSSVRDDVRISIGWLYNEDYEIMWQRRVAWLLDELSKRLPKLEHIVIDLPPGVFGFTWAIMGLCAVLTKGERLPDGFPDWTTGDVEWKPNPCLIVSQDQNDLVSGLEYYRLVFGQIGLRLIVNRITDAGDSVRKFISEQPGSVKAYIIANFGDTLGRIFQMGTNNIDLPCLPDVQIQALKDAFFVEAE